MSSRELWKPSLLLLSLGSRGGRSTNNCNFTVIFRLFALRSYVYRLPSKVMYWIYKLTISSITFVLTICL